VWAAPELLGAPTIGGGSARPWDGGGEVMYTFTAIRNSQKRQKTGGFAHILAYKSPKTPFFAQKYFTRYTYSQDVFRGIHKFSSSLLKPLHTYTSSKFQKFIYAPSRTD
jgi:hypothetical protein